ncbi:DNA polymerase Y family protein [Rhodoferax sp.]|uniref:Y-family DNA polymerase n=1 Tax=Rhodoferax sp. TaxID=50421 RepID=UPI00284A4CC3|nr:DNA polymerase Y family protein [Rhodoferax sp.]MDR3370045.1 DNA polymerase Y family protein [Rhodoferax sp.]
MHWIALQPQPEAAAPADTLTDPLTALGWWALQFTPKVAQVSGAVLLEVSASARLWGGQTALLRHIHMEKKPVAPVIYGQGDTSLIAFARLDQPHRALVQTDDLPLSALLAAQPHLGTLARLGCTRWGQLRALPRAGVARRFGAALVDALDQAYGTRPDVYPWLTLPDVFEATLELTADVGSAPALLFGARRLLAQLSVWLQMRQRGVLAIELGWTMDARRNTAKEGALVLRTSQASADMTHLQRLLAERLGQVALAAPVQSLRLRSLETQALQGVSASLLLDDQPQGDSLGHLLERLSARLGADKVLCLQALADHRPEQMQAWTPAARDGHSGAAGATPAVRHKQSQANTADLIAEGQGDTGAAGQKIFKKSQHSSSPKNPWASALYPTWLLAEPLKLAVYQQQPHYLGPLTLLAGPQRLESGWWAAPTASPVPQERLAAALQLRESAPAALRDYYVARSEHSPLLWVYRERLGSMGSKQPAPAWFLHGVFG